MSPNREKLRQLVDDRCLDTDTRYTLSRGTQSGFYFDCKKAMLDGECLSLIAEEFLVEAEKLPVPPKAIGGLTMGADFIVAAVIQRAFQTGRPTLSGSIVRKEPKKHGTRSRIENELPAGTRIMVIDDVITSGASTEAACEEYLAGGYEIAGIVALVDREAGGCERLAEKYRCPVRAVFTKSDFPRIGRNVNDAPRSDEAAALGA